MGYLLPPERVVDVERHAGEQAPSHPVPKPPLGSQYELDQGVIDGE